MRHINMPVSAYYTYVPYRNCITRSQNEQCSYCNCGCSASSSRDTMNHDAGRGVKVKETQRKRCCIPKIYSKYLNIVYKSACKRTKDGCDGGK